MVLYVSMYYYIEFFELNIHIIKLEINVKYEIKNDSNQNLIFV
jgi:hypothetical protein